jgi:transposase-like protein
MLVLIFLVRLGARRKANTNIYSTQTSMKHCPFCKHELQHWGKTAAGATRFYCSHCKRTATNKKRKDVRERHLRYELDLWLGGKDSLQEIAARYGSTRQTLWKHFRPLLAFPFEPSIPQEPIHTLILDATYIHSNQLCALVAIDEKDRVYWRFAPYESYDAWYRFLKLFPKPEVVVMDGQKGLFLAATRLWPFTGIQRCQFHVVSFVSQYTGRRPKDGPAREILDILYQLKNSKTPEGRDRWKILYHNWERKYQPELYAKNVWGNFQYPRLRSVRFIIRKAMPNLFTFLEYPDCPNTTNLVEGWVNSAVAEAIRRHRGITAEEKKTLVSIILSHLKRKNHKEERVSGTELSV